MTDRRTFLRSAAALLPAALVAPGCLSPRRAPTSEATADLVIIGGGLGGCAAALAALQRGLRVIMTEETEWIGGQLTQQAVPPDENAWIESIGGTRSYRAMREAIRAHYRAQPTLTAAARANPRLNPGNGWVSRLCCEPRVALAVLETQLAPFVVSGQLRILRQHVAQQAHVRCDRLHGVAVRSLIHGHTQWLTAPFFADATELGDLLPLSGTEYVTGAESRHMTGEPHAKEVAEPDNVQAFTVCFAMEHLDGEDHVEDRPVSYDAWRTTMVQVPGSEAPTRLLSFDDPGSARLGFNPVARTGYWSYRRIIDRTHFVPGTYRSDVTIVNWGQNDYSFGSLIDVPPSEAVQHVKRAKELGRSLLYWLQTECPRPDGGVGWRGLRLRRDIMGTTDGFAQYPYIRESRRIRARVTVCEQHVTREARLRDTGASPELVTATPFADSVGIGHYNMDLHLTTRGDRGQYGATLPFQIPLGALLPERMENVLPVCKNLGVTHLTNGCYRLHPIEWNIGESAGHLVAYCLAHRTLPHAVHERPAHLQALQRELTQAGVPLAWPHPLPR